MRFIRWDDPANQQRHYKIIIEDHEWLNVKFDGLDKALFKDLAFGVGVSVADMLLGLERVVRRIEERKVHRQKVGLMPEQNSEQAVAENATHECTDVRWLECKGHDY